MFITEADSARYRTFFVLQMNNEKKKLKLNMNNEKEIWFLFCIFILILVLFLFFIFVLFFVFQKKKCFRPSAVGFCSLLTMVLCHHFDVHHLSASSVPCKFIRSSHVLTQDILFTSIVGHAYRALQTDQRRLHGEAELYCF